HRAEPAPWPPAPAAMAIAPSRASLRHKSAAQSRQSQRQPRRLYGATAFLGLRANLPSGSSLRAAAPAPNLINDYRGAIRPRLARHGGLFTERMPAIVPWRYAKATL